jgi:hypothetical protein
MNRSGLSTHVPFCDSSPAAKLAPAAHATSYRIAGRSCFCLHVSFYCVHPFSEHEVCLLNCAPASAFWVAGSLFARGLGRLLRVFQKKA